MFVLVVIVLKQIAETTYSEVKIGCVVIELNALTSKIVHYYKNGAQSLMLA
jgi:hypothetical protein